MTLSEYSAIACRMLFFFAAWNFLTEGRMEVKIVRDYFLSPPSVPGESKILEHFALQHIVYPMIGFGIALYPMETLNLLDEFALKLVLFASMLMVAIPETVVSFRKGGDLFRPYPFPVTSPLRKRIYMFKIGTMQLNFLQLKHLLLNHWMYSAVFGYFILYPDAIKAWLSLK
jgi:hypothetical protein